MELVIEVKVHLADSVTLSFVVFAGDIQSLLLELSVQVVPCSWRHSLVAITDNQENLGLACSVEWLKSWGQFFHSKNLVICYILSDVKSFSVLEA